MGVPRERNLNGSSYLSRLAIFARGRVELNVRKITGKVKQPALCTTNRGRRGLTLDGIVRIILEPLFRPVR